MATQTTYSERQGKGRAGQVATMNPSDADTKICETAAGIGFGLACGRGSADKGAVLGAGAAAQFLGISIRDITLENSGAGLDKYAQYQNMAVLKQGVIWVVAGGNVQDGQDVTFNSTTGVLSSTAADGTNFAIPGARWVDTASSGEMARVALTGQMTGA